MALQMISEVPFMDCDADTQNVDATGAALSAIFTNLARTNQRELVILNNGNGASSDNVVIGKSLAAARWPIAPGSSFTVRPQDLARLFIKSSTGTQSVSVFQVI